MFTIITCVPSISVISINDASQSPGPRAAAVPGEIRGYFEAKRRFGNPAVSMKSLIEPSIRMCLQGIRVTDKVASALKGQKERILNDPGMK